MRAAVRGEFTVAMESLTSERGALMNQLSDVRLKLAEAQSEREAAEKQWKAHADEEAAKIHARSLILFPDYCKPSKVLFVTKTGKDWPFFRTIKSRIYAPHFILLKLCSDFRLIDDLFFAE